MMRLVVKRAFAAHSMLSPRRSPAAVAAGLVAAVCAMVFASPAVASRGHVFGGAFGSAGSGLGQLSEPMAVAVGEASGDVYVLDRGNDRVEVFSAAGAPEGQFNGGSSFEVKGKLESTEPAPAGTLAEPNAIAVDNACVQQGLSEASIPKCKDFDPSNGDVYVADGFGHNAIEKFAPDGAFVGQVLVPGAEADLFIQGLAVDPRGALWVFEKQKQQPHVGFDRFSSAVKNEWQGFAKTPGQILVDPGFAVDAAENLYGGIQFGPPLEETIAKFRASDAKGEVLSEAHVLSEALVEETSNGVATEFPSNDVYVDNVSSIRRVDAKEPAVEVERFGLGDLPGTDCSALPYVEQAKCRRGGVAVDSLSGTVFVAVSPDDEVQVFPLEPPGPPTVEGESVAQITASSAGFRGVVNPRGASTEYRFEYGPCASESTCVLSPFEHSVPVPDGSVGSALDFEAHEVSAHVQGLLPATTYHFRVVAHNGLGKGGGPPEEVLGEEESFTTQPVGVFGLPDGRAWELVSPAHKRGARLEGISESTPIQAAVSGDAITYLSDSPSEAEPRGYTNSVQILSARRASGWVSTNVVVPHEQATGQSVGEGVEYRFSSEDLSRAVIQPFGSFVALSPRASEATAYLHTNLVGAPGAFCEAECFTPLVTAANTREGVQFGGSQAFKGGQCPPLQICGPVAVGATSDLAHVLLYASVGLTETPGDTGGLYEWSAGKLTLVSILPEGQPSPPLGTVFGENNQVTRHAVSPDGQRVVWAHENHVYLRELGSEETVELDEGLTGEARFQTASSQTTKIFFTENAKESSDLYVYDTETGKRTRLTSGAGVQGVIAGASEDGRYLYLVTNGALSEGEGAVSGDCAGPVSATGDRCNLYELHESEGAWGAKLVGVLSGEDFPDFSPSLPGLTARVSPNGRYLAFMSRQSLTEYDNRDASSGRPDEEVFLFDAETGHLSCASCNPTGARPEGIEYKQLENGLVAGNGVWRSSTWIASNIPGWTPYKLSTAAYQSRYLDDSGRLFFNSSDALSPQDVNGTEDVYELEPAGIGDCTTASPSFSRRSSGCVALISAGSSREESAFLDASASGGDVFFLTTSKLVPQQDFDAAYDLYDAHQCTTTSPCIAPPAEPPPPCESDAACKPTPTPQPQIFAAPASATFNGQGNISPAAQTKSVKAKTLTRAQRLANALKACRARYRHSPKRRRSCEAKARKAHRAASANAGHRATGR